MAWNCDCLYAHVFIPALLERIRRQGTAGHLKKGEKMKKESGAVDINSAC